MAKIVEHNFLKYQYIDSNVNEIRSNVPLYK